MVFNAMKAQKPIKIKKDKSDSSDRNAMLIGSKNHPRESPCLILMEDNSSILLKNLSNWKKDGFLHYQNIVSISDLSISPLMTLWESKNQKELNL